MQLSLTENLNLKFVLLGICLSQSLSYGQAEKQSINNDNKVYNIILCTNTFHNAKDEDFVAVSKVIANHFQQTSQVKGDIKVLIAGSKEDILAYTNKPFDMIVISTQDYFEIKNTRPLEPALINYINGSIGQKFLLVTHKSENVTSLSQLKDKSMLIESREGQNSPRFWLDKLLRTQKLLKKEKFFSEVKYENRVTNTLLPVFFRKVQAAIVTESGFKLVAELNPQIKRDMIIVAESMNIADGIVCINSSEKDFDRKQLVIDMMLGLHKSTYGLQLLVFFATDKVVPFKSDYLNAYLELFK